MECQVDKPEPVRNLLFASNEGHKAARGICAVYGEDFINDRMALSVPWPTCSVS